jgi:hypothetical protein
MTPEQADLIRKSFDTMWTMHRSIAVLCYGRFFKLAPEARSLFPRDMERQQLKLMNMIAALVGALEEKPRARPPRIRKQLTRNNAAATRG